MSVSDMIIVSVVVLAFVVFAAVLAWGDYRTRHLDRQRQKGNVKAEL